MITRLQLMERMTYNPKTGLFRWLKTGNNFRKIGSIAGSINPFGYIRISIDDRRYMAHRLAWLYMTGEWPEYDLDHINLDKADNRWVNLREATRSQNIANTPLSAANSSGIKGVWWHRKRSLWQAGITHHGKQIRLGFFVRKDEAGDAYAKAAQEIFGEFARTE